MAVVIYDCKYGDPLRGLELKGKLVIVSMILAGISDGRALVADAGIPDNGVSDDQLDIQIPHILSVGLDEYFAR